MSGNKLIIVEYTLGNCVYKITDTEEVHIKLQSVKTERSSIHKRIKMNANLGGWIHSFTVTETMTHKKGYTIYKITSIVFPRAVPQALTCITVWKRFHDIKRLYRELCRRQKLLQISGKIPEPTDSTFFKRFDAGIIHKRKNYILLLLDFVAQHPALYKCHAFTQFFSDGHSSGTSPLPFIISDMQDDEHETVTDRSAIVEICDNLDMHYDQQQLSLLDPKLHDNDTEGDKSTDTTATESLVKAETLNNILSNEDSEVKEEKPILSRDYSRFLTPMASIESEDSDYIYEAALEFSKAVQAEANLEYKEAYEKYKKGVEVLLNGSKDDSDNDRKLIAKTKISKYFTRAVDIYEKFLRDNENKKNSTHFQLTVDVTDDKSPQLAALYLERPWNHLAKYKVLRILGDSVMLVQSITAPLRPTYVMKGIEKPSSNSPSQTVFLPQGVAYMVELLAFFQSEQKIFLLLKQAEGGRLFDYVLSYQPQTARHANLNHIFPEIGSTNIDSDANVQNSAEEDASPKSAAPNEQTDFPELVRCSQQLLKSVSNTLKESKSHEFEQTIKEPLLTPTKATIIHKPRLNENSIHDPHLPTLPEACLKQWARELAVAINCLHSKGIILSDLHSDNLLLGNKGQLLLTYFYQNEVWNADENYVHKAYNPLALAGHYVSPERPLTYKSDWWSYGVILYNLLLGLSFKEAHPGHIDLYGCVQYPENAVISENARDLLDNLLQAMPEERFNYEDIQKHAFFQGTDWKEVLKKGF